VEQVILEAAKGLRKLTSDDLEQVVHHVASAGFDPGMYKGMTATDRHYPKHVIREQKWPPGTTLEGYLESIRRVIRDPTSGLFTSRYLDAGQLGIVRPAGELRGPRGRDYVLIEYRVEIGYWVTAHQLARGLEEILSPQRTELRWLRPLR
jgi:hypothetical protein